MSNLPDLLTPEIIKDLLPTGAISTQTIRKACASGSIPAQKIGRRWVIPRDKFLSFVNGNAGEVAND